MSIKVTVIPGMSSSWLLAIGRGLAGCLIASEIDTLSGLRGFGIGRSVSVKPRKVA